MTKKRILAWVLTLLMLMNFMPMNVLAEETAIVAPETESEPVREITSASVGYDEANEIQIDFSGIADEQNQIPKNIDDVVDSNKTVGDVLDNHGIQLSEDVILLDNSGNPVAKGTVVSSSMSLLAAKAGEAGTWTVNFRDRDGNIQSTRTVADGEAIGELPSVPFRDDYTGHWETAVNKSSGGQEAWSPTGTVVTADYTVTEDLDVIAKYDTVDYSVTFYTDATTQEVVGTRTTNVESLYCVDDLPVVPEKPGFAGHWVYSGGTFDNTVNVKENNVTKVWAEYTQTEFTVTFMSVNEDDEPYTYQTDTYTNGDALVLASDPVVEGKEFLGWYNGETKYNGGESVTSDLTLTAKFNSKYYVRFVIRKEDTGAAEDERLSQYFRTAGETIGTMPEDPFVAGKAFENWVDEKGNEVTAATTVDDNMVVYAVFRDVVVYSINVVYFYKNDAGNDVTFNTDLYEVETEELPYTITAPASTQTNPNEVAGGPTYYAKTQSVQVNQADFTGQYADDDGIDTTCTVKIEYVSHTAVYDFVYMLKNLTGEGYTEITDERERDVKGVLGSTVTPEVKEIEYAVFESAETAEITQESGQELKVYYTRKSYQLTYETNGGSYVGGGTYPYGTSVALTTTTPTKDGYTFEGWYSDEELTERVTGSVTIEGDTTLYANWTGKNVNYTIVYMFEKYNDTGTASSYVYDNSRNGTAQVGSTVQASSVPAITRRGWEADTAKNATSSVVIAADGSSVLFVYYKLSTFTLTFNRNHQSRHTDYIVRPDGSTTTETYSITVKLGQDISTLWPSGDCDNNNCNFRGWQKNGQGTRYITKQLIMNDDLLPATGTTLTWYANWGYATEHTVNYYLENADDDGYTKSETYSQTYYSDSNGLNPKQILGYTYDHDQNSGNTFNFYYKRDTFKIDYYYSSTKLNTIENVKFDANINKSPYTWTPTTAQCGVDSDYTFDGWYSDSGLTTPYTFSTMPASNLVLYAKWTPPTFTVTYVDGENPSTVYGTKTDVSKYSKVSALETTPVKDGYIFDGWYTTATGTELFDWNTQITADTTIYAHWTQKTLSYTVRYVDEDGEPVATGKTVTNPNFKIGDTVTEQAVGVVGYRPKTNTETLTLKGNEEDDVITFVYVLKADETSYIVKYVIADGEEGAGLAVAPEKPVTGVPGDTVSVIEAAAAVSSSFYTDHPEFAGKEFYPDAPEKKLTLAADEEQNVLTFYYSSYKSVSVTINFVDMNGEPIHDPDSQILKVGKTLTLGHTPIAEWEFNKAVEGTSYSGTEADTEYKITNEVADNGTLVFTLFYQKKATITVNNQTKQYDGEALTLPEGLANQVKTEGLLDGDTLASVEYSYAGADNPAGNGRINAGETIVTPKNATISGAHNANYYSIRYVSGTLEVTPIHVTIRIEPDRWANNRYDGEVKQTGFTNPGKGIEDYVQISHDGYKETYLQEIWNKVNSAPVTGDTSYTSVTHEADAAGLGYVAVAEKDAGTYVYNVGFTRADLPKNDNYSVQLFVRSGSLEILPAELTVTTGTDSKPYDGTALTKDEATLTGLVDADKEKVTVKATGTQTVIGSSENTYEINWGGVNQDNYSITEELGTLTVTATYIVEFYYQNDDGTYPTKPNDQVTHEADDAEVGETVSVTEEDKADKEESKYTYDAENTSNIESAELTETGATLKLYFKLNKFGYTIHHYLNSSEIKVADDQTGEEVFNKTVTAKAYAPDAKELYDDYKKVVFTSFAPESGSVTIQVNESENVIIVYYVIPETIDPGKGETTFGKKKVTAAAEDGEDKTFSFTLAAVTEGAPMPESASASLTYASGETDEEGSAIPFGTITYDKVGEYKYTITEADAGAGWTTKGNNAEVTVNVEPGAAGTLNVTVTGGTIENSYKPNEITVIPTDAETTFGKKNVTAAAADGKVKTFSFTLAAVTEGAPMPEEPTVTLD